MDDQSLISHDGHNNLEGGEENVAEVEDDLAEGADDDALGMDLFGGGGDFAKMFGGLGGNCEEGDENCQNPNDILNMLQNMIKQMGLSLAANEKGCTVNITSFRDVIKEIAGPKEDSCPAIGHATETSSRNKYLDGVFQ